MWGVSSDETFFQLINQPTGNHEKTEKLVRYVHHYTCPAAQGCLISHPYPTDLCVSRTGRDLIKLAALALRANVSG